MSHRQIKQQLGEYLEGNLVPSERRRTELHLEECSACSEELAGLRRVRELLRELPTPEPPPFLADAVMAQLRAGEARVGPLARLAAWWSEVSSVGWPVPIAAAAMGAVALAVLRGGDVPTTPTALQPAALIAAPAATAPAPRSEPGLVMVSRGVAQPEPAPAPRAPAGTAVSAKLPPIEACLRTGRTPQTCIRWHAYMVGLAVRDPAAFLNEVALLPEEDRDPWLQQLEAFARESGSAPQVARELRAQNRPDAEDLAVYFERAARAAREAREEAPPTGR